MNQMIMGRISVLLRTELPVKSTPFFALEAILLFFTLLLGYLQRQDGVWKKS